MDSRSFIEQEVNQMTTEEKIKEAATKVFINKGFRATRTRDIAEEAGINIASLHYYYRSKEKLFDIVIGEAIRQFTTKMDAIFNSDTPLKEKIYLFVDRYIDFFKANPQIPIFIMSEAQNNPERVSSLLKNENSMAKLKNQINELIEKGEIRNIHPAHFFISLLSLTAFPFLSKPIMVHKMGISDIEFSRLLEERKKIVPEIIIGHMFLDKG